ncbi:hemiasterlin resistant protein 1 [Tripterygium wilfordii]|uniref:Hemiasterlin resistant protein 1 n=1 Tax=Tripterygium wilfordii TaxID=458696 RepID=A0A7J7CH51_TRIWF|nr:hemiasterlin resistant protein 1 [Tripterygium wilfordii]
MARRSSGGRSASRPAPRSAPARNPPQTVNHAPPPAPAQGGSGGSMLGGIGSTIAQGLAFGTGSAMAHRAVDSVMGPRTIQHETVASETAAPAPTTNSLGGSDGCNNHYKAFQDLCIWILLFVGSNRRTCGLVVELHVCNTATSRSRVQFLKQSIHISCGSLMYLLG